MSQPKSTVIMHRRQTTMLRLIEAFDDCAVLIGMLSAQSLLHPNYQALDDLSVYCEDIYHCFPASLFR